MTTKVPHYWTIVGFCATAILGYGSFSAWAVLFSHDQTLLGDVGGTWKSFAVAAFAFWLGSSMGGKAKDNAPVPVNVTNTPDDPVPTQDAN